MLQLRRVLTEILLNVTNAEMYSIAEETLKKEKLKGISMSCVKLSNSIFFSSLEFLIKVILNLKTETNVILLFAF